MSFLSKGGSSIKPVIIIVAILLIVGGAYSLVGPQKEEIKQEAKEASVTGAQVQPSGVNRGQKVANAGDVEDIVAKWIAANPKAIIESVSNLQRKAAEDQVKNAQKNIAIKKAELEHQSSPAIAPAGYDVTIIEFFDYLCGYCKKAQATVESLLKEDKKIRFIYKEYPILGQASVELSKVAVAVSLIDNDAYVRFHNALMQSNVRTKDAAIATAKSIGVDVVKLKASLKDNEAKINKILQDNAELGKSIGINGTPGFIIGEELIPGAVHVTSFKEKVAALRKK